MILVHRSPEALTDYLVCGEIGGGTVGTAPLAAPGDQSPADHMPDAGVGSAVEKQISGMNMALLFFALACISAMAAVVIRKTAN